MITRLCRCSTLGTSGRSVRVRGVLCVIMPGIAWEVQEEWMRMVFEENLTGIQQALDDQVPIDCQLPDVNGEHDYIEDIPGVESGMEWYGVVAVDTFFVHRCAATHYLAGSHSSPPSSAGSDAGCCCRFHRRGYSSQMEDWRHRAPLRTPAAAARVR